MINFICIVYRNYLADRNNFRIFLLNFLLMFILLRICLVFADSLMRSNSMIDLWCFFGIIVLRWIYIIAKIFMTSIGVCGFLIVYWFIDIFLRMSLTFRIWFCWNIMWINMQTFFNGLFMSNLTFWHQIIGYSFSFSLMILNYLV